MRRPAAAAAVLAVLGVMIPVGQASAASQSITPRDGVVEAVDTSVTYDFTCDNQGMPISPIYRLWGPNGRYDYESIPISTTEGATTTGSFTIDYTGALYGSYSMVVQCSTLPQFPELSRNFTLDAPAVTTQTTLTATDNPVVPGRATTLRATVSGGATGMVDFYAAGEPIGAAPLSLGVATVSVVVDDETSYTAAYRGSAGFEASGSDPLVVGVVTAVTAPGSATISGPVVVGEPLTVSTDGWSPADVALSYTWTANDVPVGTDATFTPTPAQLGQTLRVRVTGSLDALTPGHVSSAGSVVALGSIQTGDLELDGLDDRTVVLGQTITPRPVGFGSDASFTYRWIIGDDERSVISPTYTPTGADLGKTIRVEATVTAPGKAPTDAWAWAWPGVATPTVTVGSSTITVGRGAVVPVTVTGPQGAPVPTGTVAVTATPRSGGDPVVVDTVTLDGTGAASVTVSGLSVGTWDTSVAFVPVPGSSHHYAAASIDFSTNPYTEASGTGTVTVTKVTPTVKLAGTVTVPVATPAVFDVKVGGVRLPTTYVFREGDAVIGQGQLATDGTIGAVLPVLTPGDHTVTLEVAATAESFAASRSFTVVVGGEPVRSGALPTAQLDTPKAATAPGQQMELVAAGFEPGETVAFYLHSEPVFLGTAVADADGIARLLADIPADVPAGEHTVIATGGTSGRWATLAVELAVPAAAPVAAAPAATPAAATEDLAVTGAQSGLLMAGAWTMLLLGGGLVLVARRVRATR